MSEKSTALTFPAHLELDGPKNDFQDAFSALMPEYQALPESEVAIVNLDIPSAVCAAFGVAPKIRALRPRIAALPELDIDLVDKLERYAFGLSHAQAIHLAASSPKDSLRALSKEGAALRTTLLEDARALVNRGYLHGDALGRLHGPNGYKNLSVDLQVLAVLFQTAWPAIEGKCGVTLAELHRASWLAHQMLWMIGRRRRPEVRGTADLRARAFTLFVRAYDQARRAVSYLEWGGGVESVPSLYTRRHVRKGRRGREAGEGAGGGVGGQGGGEPAGVGASVGSGADSLANLGSGGSQ